VNSILHQPAVAGLGESKLPLDHPEHIFHLCLRENLPARPAFLVTVVQIGKTRWGCLYKNKEKSSKKRNLRVDNKYSESDFNAA
jgi:hypothetical protein